MPLHYALYRNPVKNNQSYRALIKRRETYDLDDVIEKMVSKGTTLTRADSVAAIELFTQVIQDILKDGGVVSTPLLHAECSISGIFKKEEDRFFSNRHKVKINLRAGKRLKDIIPFITTKKIQGSLPGPGIKRVDDLSTGSVNSSLTIGRPVMISGKRLKFKEADEKQGVFLTDEHGVDVKLSIVHRNTFSKILVILPDQLKKGTYYLSVKSDLNTKDIRVGQFEKTLNVC